MFLNDEGIPISNYGYIDGKLIGRQISITATTDKALDYWNKYDLGNGEKDIIISYDFDKRLAGDKNLPNNNEEAKQKFINCADWLLSNVVEYDDYSIWEYSYDSFCNMKAPWRSSQAQGMAIMVMLRAYKLTKQQKYLNCAYKAVVPFRMNISEGGFVDVEDGWWFDKFADRKSDGPKVLNGMMFALIALGEFSEQNKRPEFEWTSDAFERGLTALFSHLPKYDAGDWSYYNRYRKKANDKYHRIHYEQLLKLYEMTKKPLLLEYHHKFKEYVKNRPNES